MSVGLSLAPQHRVFAAFAIYAFCLGNIFPRLPDIQHSMGVAEGALGLALIGAPVGTLLALIARPRRSRKGRGNDMSEKEVLSVIRGQEDATAKGDARANVDVMDADVVVFDLPPPLVYRGEQARDIEGINAWFATWRHGVTVHMADPQLIIDGDLAVAFGLSHDWH